MRPSGLDDPDRAAFAWARYRRILRTMTGVALAGVAAGLLLLYVTTGRLPLHDAIATSLGIFFTVMLGAALMGLVFLSSGTGHDDSIGDPFEDDHQ